MNYSRDAQDNGPYVLGVQTVPHRNAKVTTTLHTAGTDNLIANLENAYIYDVGYVPAGFEHRPDLISNVFYGTPKNWWLLMQVNSISDPFEGFKVGDRILIPRI